MGLTETLYCSQLQRSPETPIISCLSTLCSFPPLASVTFFMNTITCAITRYIYVCILLKWCKIFQKRKCSCIIIVLHLIKCSYYSLLSQKGETWYFKQTLAKVNQRVIPKICPWARYQNRHSSKSIEVIKLSFCQNDSQEGGSFWQKDRLITYTLFELCLF